MSGLISGAHVMIFSRDPEADRTFFKDVLGLDSVDVVSIVSQIERRFRIRLSQQELEKLATVADVLNLLHDKLSAGPETAAAA